MTFNCYLLGSVLCTGDQETAFHATCSLTSRYEHSFLTSHIDLKRFFPVLFVLRHTNELARLDRDKFENQKKHHHFWIIFAIRNKWFIFSLRGKDRLPWNACVHLTPSFIDRVLRRSTHFIRIDYLPMWLIVGALWIEHEKKIIYINEEIGVFVKTKLIPFSTSYPIENHNPYWIIVGFRMDTLLCCAHSESSTYRIAHHQATVWLVLSKQ